MCWAEGYHKKANYFISFLLFLNFFFFARRDLTISARSANAILENEIIDSLPDEESGRSGYLFDMTMDALVYFIDSHTLEVNFPKAIARAIEGGRIIKKKYMSAVALALALKALIIAKIALFMKHHKGGHHSSLVEMVTDIANWEC